MYVSTMAFHAKISDPSIGGTYLTLLNTMSNFGMISIVRKCAIVVLSKSHNARLSILFHARSSAPELKYDIPQHFLHFGVHLILNEVIHYTGLLYKPPFNLLISGSVRQRFWSCRCPHGKISDPGLGGNLFYPPHHLCKACRKNAEPNFDHPLILSDRKVIYAGVLHSLPC